MMVSVLRGNSGGEEKEVLQRSTAIIAPILLSTAAKTKFHQTGQIQDADSFLKPGYIPGTIKVTLYA